MAKIIGLDGRVVTEPELTTGPIVVTVQPTDRAIIAMLEARLSEARAGLIRGIAIIATDHDGLTLSEVRGIADPALLGETVLAERYIAGVLDDEAD